MKIERHWGISLLAILAVGPGLMLNSALTPLQGLLQKTLDSSSYPSIIPILTGTIAFALFVPLGPFLRHKWGDKTTYITSACISLLGVLLSLISTKFIVFEAGRVLQGMGAGMALMMMLPMLVLSFPISRRNLALLILIGGFYGSSMIGVCFGTLVSHTGHWKEIFYVAVACSILAILLGYTLLSNEGTRHAKEKAHFDWMGFVWAGIFALLTAFTVLSLQKWGGSSLYVWIGLGGSVLAFIFLFITEYSITKPLLSFKLILHKKPLLAILVVITGYIAMTLSLVSLQGILKTVNALPNKEMVIVYLCLLVGVAVAAILSCLLYDKLGPGILGMIGALLIIGVNLTWMYAGNHEPYTFFATSFFVLILGVGFTIASGLMGAALGGPLPDLVPRMATVQFLRMIAYAAIPVISSYILNRFSEHHLTNGSSQDVSEQSVEKSQLLAYHDLFFSSFSASLVLLCFSFLIALTGKGHKLAHKPHHQLNEEYKENSNEKVVQPPQPPPLYTKDAVIPDHDYRKALQKFKQLKSSQTNDDVFREALKKFKEK
ncbi:MFS transporter [Priestia endophytica]|uniref:MFS transporter n=1 Tax=Priestia endophytica TaxID=135735 RepID=UPI000DCA57D2|nr:MFS transporter [Priestia endophytica]RAS83717.1 hypothetical protein A4U60_11010 [Priestia endophytica]